MDENICNWWREIVIHWIKDALLNLSPFKFQYFVDNENFYIKIHFIYSNPKLFW